MARLITSGGKLLVVAGKPTTNESCCCCCSVLEELEFTLSGFDDEACNDTGGGVNPYRKTFVVIDGPYIIPKGVPTLLATVHEDIFATPDCSGAPVGSDDSNAIFLTWSCVSEDQISIEISSPGLAFSCTYSIECETLGTATFESSVHTGYYTPVCGDMTVEPPGS